MQPVHMPSWWEGLIQGYLKRTFYQDTRRSDFAGRTEFTEGDYRFFVPGVRALNLSFTQERGSLAKNYFNQKPLRSGYILYFLPINALKVAALLEQIPNETWNADLPITVLDVGSGPGTGMLGTFHYLETRMEGRTEASLRLRWILIDQNRHALADAQALHDLIVEGMRRRHPRWEIVSQVTPIVGDVFTTRLPRLLHGRDARGANLILGLNLLGELARERRLPLVQDMMGFLHEKGRILLMEPALRRTTRDLMELHDQVLEKELARVHAPCLHQAACPMLRSNERDWCHTYIPWERPRWIEKIDRLVAIRKDYLKGSYLLLGREEPVRVSANAWRVVSGPLNSKGKSERLLCGPAGLPGLLRTMRLDRDASEANRDFDRLQRGDLVEMRLVSRLSPDTPLKKLRP